MNSAGVGQGPKRKKYFPNVDKKVYCIVFCPKKYIRGIQKFNKVYFARNQSYLEVKPMLLVGFKKLLVWYCCSK